MEGPREDVSPVHRGGPRGGPRNQRFVPKEPRTAVEHIREATGASVDIIQYQLRECEGDVNKATEQLIDTPFKIVRTKKPRAKPFARGGRRGGGYDHAGGRFRSDGPAPTRGRGTGSRGTGGSRAKSGGRHRAENAEKNFAESGVNETGTAAAAVVAEEEEEEVKTKSVTPPQPIRKAYLEALCGKPKVAEESGFLVQKMELDPFPPSGWEVANSPLDTLVPAFHGPPSANETHSEEEKVDSVANVKDEDVKEEAKSRADEAEHQDEPDVAVQEAPDVDVFPYPMKDIRFTRADTTPVMPCQMPISVKVESSLENVLNLDDVKLDTSTIEYLFGTFAGLSTTTSQPEPEPEPQPLQQIMPVPVPEQMPIQEETTSSLMEETELSERLESVSLKPEPAAATATTAAIDVESRLQSLQRTSVGFLSSSVDATPQLSTVDNFPTSKSSDFRLDVTAPSLDVSLSQPTEEKSVLTSSDAPVKEEPAVARPHLLGTEASRSDKPFANAVPLQDKSQHIPALDEPSEFAKPSYQDSFVPAAAAVEQPKKEELSTFEMTETRPQPQPHRQSTPGAETKPVMEPEPSFGMTSGPAPSLPIPSYQPQRHASQTHKLPEKPVPTQVGSGVGSHQPTSKYNAHPTGGITPGQNPNAAVHVPTSINSNNASGNQSMPLIPQVPFISPGIMPNPAIPFHTANPYYPHLMQYQHQMYHGMYAAGTYGGFGAPFNHESVGHPAHASPVGKPLQTTPGFHEMMPPPGVPPNQGNTVYDTNNPSSFSTNKEKDNVFLNQQQLPHAGFPGGPQTVPRNEAGIFYSLHGQPPFSQGFRSQFHQPPGFNGQFPGGGFVAPPHTYHPTGQGNNLRFH